MKFKKLFCAVAAALLLFNVGSVCHAVGPKCPVWKYRAGRYVAAKRPGRRPARHIAAVDRYVSRTNKYNELLLIIKCSKCGNRRVYVISDVDRRIRNIEEAEELFYERAVPGGNELCYIDECDGYYEVVDYIVGRSS